MREYVSYSTLKRHNVGFEKDLLTKTFRNISNPHTVVPTRHCVRPVQVPSGVTGVRCHGAINIALCLSVHAI